MMLTTPKTIEFAIRREIPTHWKQALARVWNEAVFMLSWHEHQENLAKLAAQCGLEWSSSIVGNIEDSGGLMVDRRLEIRWKKRDGKWLAYQPLRIDRRIDRTKSWDKDNLESVSVFDLDSDRRPWVNPKWLEPTPLTGVTAIDLRKPFAQKRCEWLAEMDVPQTLINDFIGLTVAPAWAAYKSQPDRGRPKYKRPGELISTIPCESVRGQGRYLGGDRMILPGLSAMVIPGLARRLMDPLARMTAAMRANPGEFPAIEAKIQSLRETARGKLMKADGISIGVLRKQKVDPTEIDATIARYDALVDDSDFLDTAISYFSMPGSFRLLERDGWTYLQLTAVAFPLTAKPSEKEVGIDTGVDLLVASTSGLVVKHKDFSKEEKRLSGLDRAMARCVHGSNAWKKLKAKKNRLEGEVKRSKRARQAYFASQVTDVYGTIAVRRIAPLKAVAIPVPRPDGEGGYLPNGRKDSKERNKKVIDCATGQFVLLLNQQARARGRNITTVDVSESANAEQILEVSKTSSRAVQARDIAPVVPRDETVGKTASGGNPSRGKGNRLLRSESANKKQDPPAIPPAGAAKPVKGKRRSKRKERTIG